MTVLPLGQGWHAGSVWNGRGRAHWAPFGHPIRAEEDHALPAHGEGTGQPIADVSADQLQALVHLLEEEDDDDRDYYIDGAVLEYMADRGADPALLAVLRGVLPRRRARGRMVRGVTSATDAAGDDLRVVLRDHFGFEQFRAGQEQIVRALLAGRDVLAVLPTGAGKSLPYQLAAQLLPGVTLVVTPLLALMKDQVESLRERGIPAVMVSSAQSAGEAAAALDDAERAAAKLLYVTRSGSTTPTSWPLCGACRWRCSW